MSTNSIKKKLMASATLFLVGMTLAPYASASLPCPPGGYCGTCVRVLWTWMCW
jgi:hypothetical protein